MTMSKTMCFFKFFFIYFKIGFVQNVYTKCVSTRLIDYHVYSWLIIIVSYALKIYRFTRYFIKNNETGSLLLCGAVILMVHYRHHRRH